MTDSTLVEASSPAHDAEPEQKIYLQYWSFDDHVRDHVQDRRSGPYAGAGAVLDRVLGEIENELNERTIGETTTPFRAARSLTAPKSPRIAAAEERQQKAVEYILDVLRTVSEGLAVSEVTSSAKRRCSQYGRATLLLELSRACDKIWEDGLPYRTLEAVQEGAERFAGELPNPDAELVEAALGMVNLTLIDSHLFEAINGGRPGSVIGVLDEHLDEVEQTRELLVAEAERVEITSRDHLADLVKEAIGSCASTKRFYEAIRVAASCLEIFERWMAAAPRFGSQQPTERIECSNRYEELTVRLSKAVTELEKSVRDVGEDETVASRCEPWLQLLVDLRETLKASSEGSPPFGRVFVPERVMVRNCFPFAVNFSHEKFSQDAVEDHIWALDPALAPFGAHQPKGGLRSHVTREPRWVAAAEADAATAQTRVELLQHRLQHDLGPLQNGDISYSPLSLSGFWLDSGYGVYGGRRVQLHNVLILQKEEWEEVRNEYDVAQATIEATGQDAATEKQKAERARKRYESWLQSHTYEVWIELSRMGNHCLCIEPLLPLSAGANDRTTLPNKMYDEVRLATPWSAQTVVFARLEDDRGRKALQGEPRWDGAQWNDLREFAHEIVLRTAHALGDPITAGEAHRTFFDRADKHSGTVLDVDLDYLPGNLHEVITVKTDVPIVGAHGDVVVELDKMIGAQVVLRSANRIASTLTEWLRVPVQTFTNPESIAAGQSSEGRIAPLPFIGFSGDWFAYTGNTTVLGEVAVPSWLSMAYVEVAQFAASWIPLLQLWSLRLEDEIRTAHGHRGHRSATASERLRIVDQEIRRQTSELRSAQLCQSELHRRFLDVFLSESGVTRLEKELDSQLMAAERLVDWYDEKRRQSSEDSRNILLVIIGVFGVFGLASYLTLVNGRNDPQYRGPFQFMESPGREVALVLGVFLVISLFGVWVLRDVFAKLFVRLWSRHKARRSRRIAAKQSDPRESGSAGRSA